MAYNYTPTLYEICRRFNTNRAGWIKLRTIISPIYYHRLTATATRIQDFSQDSSERPPPSTFVP